MINQFDQKLLQVKALAGSIAHEVRNPLANIKQSCEIVRDSLNEAINCLDLVYNSANRGLMICEMILANIRQEKIDKANFTQLSMAKIVEMAINEFAFGSKQEQDLINLNLKNDFVFKGDETLMIFILFNLLKNSLYYKAKIDIWLEITDKSNQLHFKDYGVGIAQDKINHIFDDFFTSNKKGGTGLGLPFCKRIIQAFDGDIICHSKEGEFCEFVLSFKKI